MTEPETKEKPPESFKEEVKRILDREKDNPIFLAMAREMLLRFTNGKK